MLTYNKTKGKKIPIEDNNNNNNNNSNNMQYLVSTIFELGFSPLIFYYKKNEF